MDPWLPFFHVFPLIGAGLTWYGFGQLVEHRRRLRAWTRLEAVIVNRQRVESEGTTWAPVFEYEVAGRRHIATSAVSVGDRDIYKTGARIPVLVDPRDPQRNVVLDRHHATMRLIPLGLGLSFLLGGSCFSVAMLAGWIS